MSRTRPSRRPSWLLHTPHGRPQQPCSRQWWPSRIRRLVPVPPDKGTAQRYDRKVVPAGRAGSPHQFPAQAVGQARRRPSPLCAFSRAPKGWLQRRRRFVPDCADQERPATAQRYNGRNVPADFAGSPRSFPLLCPAASALEVWPSRLRRSPPWALPVVQFTPWEKRPGADPALPATPMLFQLPTGRRDGADVGGRDRSAPSCMASPQNMHLVELDAIASWLEPPWITHSYLSQNGYGLSLSPLFFSHLSLFSPRPPFWASLLLAPFSHHFLLLPSHALPARHRCNAAPFWAHATLPLLPLLPPDPAWLRVWTTGPPVRRHLNPLVLLIIILAAPFLQIFHFLAGSPFPPFPLPFPYTDLVQHVRLWRDLLWPTAFPTLATTYFGYHLLWPRPTLASLAWPNLDNPSFTTHWPSKMSKNAEQKNKTEKKEVKKKRQRRDSPPLVPFSSLLPFLLSFSCPYTVCSCWMLASSSSSSPSFSIAATVCPWQTAPSHSSISSSQRVPHSLASASLSTSSLERISWIFDASGSFCHHLLNRSVNDLILDALLHSLFCVLLQTLLRNLLHDFDIVISIMCNFKWWMTPDVFRDSLSHHSAGRVVVHTRGVAISTVRELLATCSSKSVTIWPSPSWICEPLNCSMCSRWFSISEHSSTSRFVTVSISHTRALRRYVIVLFTSIIQSHIGFSVLHTSACSLARASRCDAPSRSLVATDRSTLSSTLVTSSVCFHHSFNSAPPGALPQDHFPLRYHAKKPSTRASKRRATLFSATLATECAVTQVGDARVRTLSALSTNWKLKAGSTRSIATRHRVHKRVYVREKSSSVSVCCAVL